MNTITINAKKDFIRWFLKSDQLKRREAVWILNYLLTHEQLMKSIHFVENARDLEEEHIGMVISTNGTNEKGFMYYYQGGRSDNAEKVFHFIRTIKDIQIYLELHFAAETPKEYYEVLEDVPGQEIALKTSDSKMIEEVIKHSQAQNILAQIDQALDQGDEKEFMSLFDLYREFKDIVE